MTDKPTALSESEIQQAFDAWLDEHTRSLTTAAITRANLGDLRTAELESVTAALREAGIEGNDPAAGVRELVGQRNQMEQAALGWAQAHGDLVTRRDRLPAVRDLLAQRDELAASRDGWAKAHGDLLARMDKLLSATPPAPPEEPAPEPRRELFEDAFVAWYDAACSTDYGTQSRLIDDAKKAQARAMSALPVPAPEPERTEPCRGCEYGCCPTHRDPAEPAGRDVPPPGFVHSSWREPAPESRPCMACGGSGLQSDAFTGDTWDCICRKPRPVPAPEPAPATFDHAFCEDRDHRDECSHRCRASRAEHEPVPAPEPAPEATFAEGMSQFYQNLLKPDPFGSPAPEPESAEPAKPVSRPDCRAAAEERRPLPPDVLVADDECPVVPGGRLIRSEPVGRDGSLTGRIVSLIECHYADSIDEHFYSEIASVLDDGPAIEEHERKIRAAIADEIRRRCGGGVVYGIADAIEAGTFGRLP